jgi:hypothetical protein
MPKLSREPCQICRKPSVGRKLCQKHYKRWQRHGSTDQTRPEDWGEKGGHPLYESWNWTVRVKAGRVSEWDDFWRFVKDVGKKPSSKHTLRRRDSELPFGPFNCYWKESSSNADKAAYQRWWAKEHPVQAKNYYLKRHHGITVGTYNDILEQQNGKCAICFKPEHVIDKNGKRRALAVDHCHESKEIRGLLCTNCNKGIGHLKDSIELLASAITYLSKFT